MQGGKEINVQNWPAGHSEGASCAGPGLHTQAWGAWAVSAIWWCVISSPRGGGQECLFSMWQVWRRRVTCSHFQQLLRFGGNNCDHLVVKFSLGYLFLMVVETPNTVSVNIPITTCRKSLFVSHQNKTIGCLLHYTLFSKEPVWFFFCYIHAIDYIFKTI